MAGHNVSPDWVASKLQGHRLVKHAAVRLSEPRQRLKAYVVLHDEDPAEDPVHRHQQVEAWALAELPDYACPQHFSYGGQLPVNSMGKPCDWPEA